MVIALVLRHAGRIDGERRVDGDGDVRLGGVGRRPRAAQPTSSCTVAARITSYFSFLRLAHRLDRDERRHAVVQALAADALADLAELLHERDRVADADFLLHLVRRQAQVDARTR